MPDDKRNRPDEQQGGNQGPDRQRRDRKPGSGTMEPPEQPGRSRREEEEQQE
jgi:hypothetical protein